jgi:hypothetical protein
MLDPVSIGRIMSAVNAVWEKPPIVYVKIKALDDTWMVAKGTHLSDVVKTGLTKEEADAFIKLMKEP